MMKIITDICRAQVPKLDIYVFVYVENILYVYHVRPLLYKTVKLLIILNCHKNAIGIR
jgi:hypothetical protein